MRIFNHINLGYAERIVAMSAYFPIDVNIILKDQGHSSRVGCIRSKPSRQGIESPQSK